jgi:hypothetical protein
MQLPAGDLHEHFTLFLVDGDNIAREDDGNAVSAGHGDGVIPKSNNPAGGATEINPEISGRRISNCMPIQAPKEKPAIHTPVEFTLCI